MSDLIRVKRGNQENLPPLATGEFGYCMDTKNLYIGGLEGNDIINASEVWTEGKSVNIFGDSLSATYDTHGTTWPYQIERLKFANIYNHSVGGSSIANRNVTGEVVWSNYIDSINQIADVNIVFLGQNDWARQIPIGSPVGNQGNSAVADACQMLFQKIVNKWPNAINYCILPIRSNGRTGTDVGTDCTLEIYRYVIAIMAQKFGFKIIDGYKVPQMNPAVSGWFTKYYDDNVHPNTAGQKQMADYFCQVILSETSDNIATGSGMYWNFITYKSPVTALVKNSVGVSMGGSCHMDFQGTLTLPSGSAIVPIGTLDTNSKGFFTPYYQSLTPFDIHYRAAKPSTLTSLTIQYTNGNVYANYTTTAETTVEIIAGCSWVNTSPLMNGYGFIVPTVEL